MNSLELKASSAERDWLRDHGRGERELEKVFAAYFDAQGSRIEKIIRRAGEHSVIQILMHFELRTEHEALVKQVFPTIDRIMRFGAHRALKQVPGTSKAFPKFRLPRQVSQSVDHSMRQLARQGYWQRIQQSTSRFIEQHLSAGIKEGLSIQNLSKSIRDQFAKLSKRRSVAIARTETTMAMNTGHADAYTQLALDGLIEGKAWLAILDRRTRDEHEGMNEVTVPVGENFNVDGYLAPFPCHWDLPAYLRVNCRCTTVPTFTSVR